MKKIFVPVLTIFVITALTALADCYDTRIKCGSGTDADSCYDCRAGIGSGGGYPSGNTCFYNTWGDIYCCGPEAEFPTGQVCSTSEVQVTATQFAGTCNGHGACSNGLATGVTGKKTIEQASLASC
jgi:hypothetical protein